MADTFIKKKREELGLSQSQFAERSGVNLRSLQEYEQGRKPMTSVKGEVLYRISTALDCSMEDLIFEPVYPTSDASGRLYKYYIQFQDLFLPRSEPSKEKMYYTPFDDVFRTLSVDCSNLLLPVINEAFGEKYSPMDIVEQGQNEHLTSGQNGQLQKRISDSNFIILSRGGQRVRYQIECQSIPDSSILLRIFEYASAIAAESAEVTADRIRINYPKSALIYLRSTDKTPDAMTIELNTPGGNISWTVPVMKTQQFSIEDIFHRELYMFIPYYILVYENRLREIERNEEERNKLKEEYQEIRCRLEDCAARGLITEYVKSTICNMCTRILSFLFNKYSGLEKEVLPIMGGQVLDYEAKTIRNEGIKEGLKEGRQELLEELLAAGLLDKSIAEKFMHEEES